MQHMNLVQATFSNTHPQSTDLPIDKIQHPFEQPVPNNAPMDNNLQGYSSGIAPIAFNSQGFGNSSVPNILYLQPHNSTVDINFQVSTNISTPYSHSTGVTVGNNLQDPNYMAYLQPVPMDTQSLINSNYSLSVNAPGNSVSNLPEDINTQESTVASTSHFSQSTDAAEGLNHNAHLQSIQMGRQTIPNFNCQSSANAPGNGLYLDACFDPSNITINTQPNQPQAHDPLLKPGDLNAVTRLFANSQKEFESYENESSRAESENEHEEGEIDRSTMMVPLGVGEVNHQLTSLPMQADMVHPTAGEIAQQSTSFSSISMQAGMSNLLDDEEGQYLSFGSTTSSSNEHENGDDTNCDDLKLPNDQKMIGDTDPMIASVSLTYFL